MKKITLLSAVTVLLVGTPATAQEWSFEFEPYILASSIVGDAGKWRINSVSVALSSTRHPAANAVIRSQRKLD